MRGDKMYETGDARIRNDEEFVVNPLPGEAYLPHSCDEWRIGDLAAVRRMIADLEQIAKRMEAA